MNITDFHLNFFSLQGKSALVTGGNSGLGRAFALALAKAGADVFVVSIIEDDQEIRSLVEAEGVQYGFMCADITEEGVAAQAVSGCQQTFGAIDILVNSAGISLLAEVQEFGRDQWDKMLSVNLTAAFELSAIAAKQMIQQGSGKIINHVIGALFKS